MIEGLPDTKSLTLGSRSLGREIEELGFKSHLHFQEQAEYLSEMLSYE